MYRSSRQPWKEKHTMTFKDTKKAGPREGLSIRESSHIALFAAIIVISSQIAIPFPGGVPLTLQTWAISLAGMVLGIKNGVFAVIVYILLGAVGVPVFANLTGGIGIIIGPTGGFILSFPLMALTAGIGEKSRSVIRLIFWLIIGTVINFLAGMLYFSFVMSVSLSAAFTAAVLPFVPFALLRIALLPAIGKNVKHALRMP